jgi:tryptophanyl-tRNA synthetase
VPEHAELHLLLSMMTPLGWLERVPTYKDQQEKLETRICRPTAFSAIRCCSRPTS